MNELSSPNFSPLTKAIRDKILSNPDIILKDPDIMRTLVEASNEKKPANVVDLRGVALERMENRLGELEFTHQGVIAAAYENVSGTNQIHRAVLALLETADFESFLRKLSGPIAASLRVDSIKLVLETEEDLDEPALEDLQDILLTAEPGFTSLYATLGRNIPLRQIVLRDISETGSDLFGFQSKKIKSEAVIQINLGEGRMPAMLLLGSSDQGTFTPAHSTDLLAFFSGALERIMQKHLNS